MSTPASTVSLFDGRPFFEKALLHGLQTGIIPAARLDSLHEEAAKGMVQIARYFGTEFLRPDLEQARARIVNMVSLFLEDSCEGDLTEAAQSLRDNTLLSRSKGGSEMLKSLLTMPDHTHFGMLESGTFTDDHIPLLARWSLRSLADYRAELAQRSEIERRMEAAYWFAQKLGTARRELKDAQTDAEALIRTGLLTLAAGRTQLPNWGQFESAIELLRKRSAAGKPVALALPETLPAAFKPLVAEMRESMLRDDLPKILDPAVKPRKLFLQSMGFMGRYYWIDDEIEDISDFDRAVSDQWIKLTQRHTDDSSLITLFLCITAGVARKTIITETTAASIVRKLRKSGLHPELASDFIRDYAPHENHADYQRLWTHFIEETRRDLLDERDTKLHEAMTALKLHCNIVDGPAKTARPKAVAKKPTGPQA
ncbi:hypothetical protein RD110_12300 [Rhodoferax koreense]|uniref:Uncharacterized protein n=1 Tax=Rhodoferax koreensis TaxID=1842727 RepID=A0A1P8JVV3_9BURK|nr:hypothetical protein [Rhodoferax koreense]APW37882.1 hypothetical protein RD110_12300 [Rhodoferax koreense]